MATGKGVAPEYGALDKVEKSPPTLTTNTELNLSGEHQLTRGLKGRHIQFLALGGSIGTGLFVGSGAILALVGPAPFFIGYLLMMFVVLTVMNDMAEMVTYLPLKGVSIPYLVERFLDPSLAFAVGWNYWYSYAMLIATEATACAIVLQYWTTAVPVGVWIAVFLVVVLLLNVIAVAFFGEAEFWFASIKLITIIGLLILGVILFFGGGPNHDRLGFRYWTPLTASTTGYGAFRELMVPGATGRFLACWMGFVRAAFAFIPAPELVALTAGEAVAPRRNIPKAASRFIWRLAAFYVLGALVIGVIVPANDPRLLGATNASASPFVIGIQNAGIEGLNHVINVAILASAWSSGNALCYSGSRVLYSLAVTGQAPAIFKATTQRGVPWAAVAFTWLVSCLAFLNVSNSGASVFSWCTNMTTSSGFIAWIVAMLTYIRFRKAMVANNMLHVLPLRTPLQPYASYFMVAIVILLTLTNGFQLFFPARWSVSDFLAAYITIPVFIALYLGHKAWFAAWQTVARTSPGCSRRPWALVKTWWSIWRFAIPIAEIDVLTGKREMDELEAMDEPPVPRNRLEKFWFWLV